MGTVKTPAEALAMARSAKIKPISNQHDHNHGVPYPRSCASTSTAYSVAESHRPEPRKLWHHRIVNDRGPLNAWVEDDLLPSAPCGLCEAAEKGG